MAINRLNPDYPDAGLVQLLPSSVSVGSGSSTTNGNGTVTFTGASSVALNTIFSSSYDNYRILFDVTDVTADTIIYMKMRNNTTDNSVNYFMGAGYVNISGGTGSSSQNTSSAGFQLSEGDLGNNLHYISVSLDLKYPFTSENTTISYQANAITGGGTLYGNYGSGVHIVETSYDGINIISSSGNITGTVSVYGYRK